MPSSDVMLDIETLATSPNSVILTFGAIRFNPFVPDEEITQAVYFRLSVDEQTALGREVNDGTVAWWATQPDAVREEAFSDEDRISLEQFTTELNKFVANAERVWAQGPVFDIVILENLYRQLNKPAPWPYYAIRDSRTLLNALGDTRSFSKDDLHNALADAFNQANAVRTAVVKYQLKTL